MLTVPVSNLSVAELKRHLSEFLIISDEDLVATNLCWRLIDKDRHLNFVCTIADNTNTNSMARHVTEVFLAQKSFFFLKLSQKFVLNFVRHVC